LGVGNWWQSMYKWVYWFVKPIRHIVFYPMDKLSDWDNWLRE